MVPWAGRMQVRRKSGCLKEKPERRVSASMHDPLAETGNATAIGGWTRGKLDEARFSKRRLFFPGHWAVQSFRKFRLLRNCGARLVVDPAQRRRSADFCQGVFHAECRKRRMQCRQKIREFAYRIVNSEQYLLMKQRVEMRAIYDSTMERPRGDSSCCRSYRHPSEGPVVLVD